MIHTNEAKSCLTHNEEADEMMWMDTLNLQSDAFSGSSSSVKR